MCDAKLDKKTESVEVDLDLFGGVISERPAKPRRGKGGRLAYKDDGEGVLFTDMVLDTDSVHYKRAVIVSNIVDRLDLSGLKGTYKGGGASCYDPAKMLKVLIYAYVCGVYSGRAIEAEWKDRSTYKMLGGCNVPNFRTINDFRSKKLMGKFDGMFTQAVKLMVEDGYVDLKEQYIDGTKIESVANKYTFVWKRTVKTNKGKLMKNLSSLLENVSAIIGRTDGLTVGESTKGDDIRREATKLEKEAARLKEATGSLDKGKLKEVEKAVKRMKDDFAPRLDGYEEHLRILGDRNSYSKTDHDATFMRLKEDAMMNGQTKPAYNVQISTRNQFVTHYSIHQRPGDTATFISHMESFAERYGIQSVAVTADSGYGSEENYQWCKDHTVAAFIKYSMFHADDKRSRKDNPFLVQNLEYDSENDRYKCPGGRFLTFAKTSKRISDLGYESELRKYTADGCSECELREQCYKGKGENRTIEVCKKLEAFKAQAKDLLKSEQGMIRRSNRPIEPEAVFGNMKGNHSFRRFRLKGRGKVGIEIGLLALGQNIRKIVSAQESDNRDVDAQESATGKVG